MHSQVERWLETFMCKQYADTFEAFGFKTLQSVCQLQVPQLQAMGVSQEHGKLILENIHILRQTLTGPTNPYLEEAPGFYDSTGRAPQGQLSSGYPGRDNQQMVRMQGNMSGYQRGSGEGFNNPGSAMAMSQQQTYTRQIYMQQQQQQQQQLMNNTPYRQTHGGPNYPNQLQCQGDIGQFPNAPAKNPMMSNKQHPFQGHDSGSNPPSMHPPHSHINRGAGQNQNPQQVADNILHMATSSYVPQNTVQVPLSTNRSAPYHVPPRSPQYNTNQGQFPQDFDAGPNIGGGCQGNRQFVYPSNSPHLQHSRMSPISPGPGVMQSPHSHHSLSNCSPAGSLHSPGPGSVRSPMSDTGAPTLKSPSCMMQNPHQMTPSPGQPHIRSPVPMSQQLQVSVPSGIPQSHPFSISPADSHHSHHSNQFSPHNDDGQFSNISSPYTPVSKALIHSPSEIYSHPTSHVSYTSDTGPPIDCLSGANNSSPSPLRSLQRLCMLPETRVVDPKSVINDSCASSRTVHPPKNSDLNTDNNVRNCKSSLSTQVQCSDGRNCSPKPDNVCVITENVHAVSDTLQRPENTAPNIPKATSHPVSKSNVCESEKVNDNSFSMNVNSVIKRHTEERKKLYTDGGKQLYDEIKSDPGGKVENTSVCGNEYVISKVNVASEEIKCQPKKLMLLRAAQDEKEQNEKKNCIESKGTPETTETVDFKNTENVIENKIEQSVKTPEKEKTPSLITLGLDEIKDDVSNLVVKEVDGFHSSINKEFVPGLSDSDDDSHLIVRKETTNTYSKTEISTRIRNQSTGSFSDEIGSSDIDFEDHIGCDDITNDLSDMSDNHYDNVIGMGTSGDLLAEVGSSLVEEIKEAVIVTEINGKSKISSPHWKKSKLNTIQTVEQNINDDKTNSRKSSRTLIKRALKQSTRKKKVVSGGRNGKNNLLSVVNNSSDEDSDVHGFITADIGSVHVGVDNGNGTMSIASRVNHSRQRKAPLKFEDAAFIQGDFIFDDDEEIYEPKRKSKKTIADHNHNTSPKNTEKSCRDNVRSIQQNVTVPNLQQENIIDKQAVKEKKATQNIDEKLKPKPNVLDDNQSNKPDNNPLRGGKSENECSTDLPVHPASNISRTDSVVSNREASKMEEYSAKHKNKVSLQSGNSQFNELDTSKPSDCDKAPKETSKHSSKSSDNGIITAAKDTKRVRNETKCEHIELRSKSCDRNSDMALPKTEVKSEIVSDGATKISANNKCAKFPENSRIDEAVVCATKDEVESDNGDEVVTIDLTNREDMQENINCDSNDVDSILVVNTETQEEISCKIKQTSGRARNQDKKRKTPKNDEISNKVKNKKNIKQKRKAHDADSDFEFGSKRNSLQSANLNKTQQLMDSKTKRVRDKLANFKGPMIRLEGSKTSPSKCIVMNQPLDESDKSKKGAKTLPQSLSTTLQISHLPSDKSVLIPHADAEEETSWLCALCGKHSSFKFLGDLFGPYTVKPLDEVGIPSSSKPQRKRKSDEHTLPGTSSSCNRRPNRRGSSQSKETEQWKEVWVHESCAVWADGVFLIGYKIYGLQEAAAIANHMTCTLCRENGAMIGCLHKGCQQKFHHSCAVDRDCYVDEENFSLLCPKHKVRKLKQQADSSMMAIS